MSLVGLITDAARDVFEAHTARWRDGREDLEALFHVCADQAWHLLAIPEELGGAGGTLRDLVAVMTSAGAAGVSVPIAELHAACHAASEAGAALSEELRAGRVGVAVPIGAREGPDNGSDLLLPWGRYLSAAYALHPEGVEWLPIALDELSLGDSLAGEPCDVLAGWSPTVGDAPRSASVLERWTLLSCARIAGAARAAARLTALHANTREQFGRPLIRFQAVSALVADAVAAADLAAAALDHAVEAVEDHQPHARTAVSCAKVVCSTVADEVSRKAHQVHGAIGVTREHQLHRYTRRLWAWRDELGSESAHAELLGHAITRGGEQLVWDATGPS